MGRLREATPLSPASSNAITVPRDRFDEFARRFCFTRGPRIERARLRGVRPSPPQRRPGGVSRSDPVALRGGLPSLGREPRLCRGPRAAPRGWARRHGERAVVIRRPRATSERPYRAFGDTRRVSGEPSNTRSLPETAAYG